MCRRHTESAATDQNLATAFFIHRAELQSNTLFSEAELVEGMPLDGGPGNKTAGDESLDALQAMVSAPLLFDGMLPYMHHWILILSTVIAGIGSTLYCGRHHWTLSPSSDACASLPVSLMVDVRCQSCRLFSVHACTCLGVRIRFQNLVQ